jgi:hypothetical protein
VNFIKGFCLGEFFKNLIVVKFEHEHKPGDYGLSLIFKRVRRSSILEMITSSFFRAHTLEYKRNFTINSDDILFFFLGIARDCIL